LAGVRVRCLYGDIRPTAGWASLGAFEDGTRSVFDADPQQRRRIRNFLTGMVYQHPRQGLNLLISAGGNVAERLLAAEWRRVDAIRDRAGHLLGRMEIPLSRMDDIPAHFSGGMQQRVQVAKALANGPSVVLLDEMTSGLDVSVQAGVLDLVQELQRSSGVAMVVVAAQHVQHELLAQPAHGQMGRHDFTAASAIDRAHQQLRIRTLRVLGTATRPTARWAVPGARSTRRRGARQSVGPGRGGRAVAIGMISRNPARAVGLLDRGALERGLRADLALVRLDGAGYPHVEAPFLAGQPVFSYQRLGVRSAKPALA
jgi:ABC-type phosphonate transport system ATPase subunit